MTLHTSFTRNIYWPLAQKLKGEYAARALTGLLESQWKSQDELFASQWQLVRRTVNKAVREVPFYRKIYSDMGWDFRNKEFSYEDFLGFPKIEKESLRDHITDFINSNYKGRVTTGKTSGSTGQSLRLYYSSEHESYSEAARWRAKDWWGVRPGSPHVAIWGRPFTGYRDRLSQKAKSYLMNTLLFSAFDLHDNALSHIWHRISSFKPSIIYGYPSAVFPLAVYLKQSGRHARHLGIKVIMIAAESSTSQQRSLIEEVFNCRTANEYGCSETGGFVYECKHGSWHISSELAFIEFLDHKGKPSPPGQTGEILITHLRNDCMPLIRYRVGDMGASLPEVCTCGRGLPLMKVSVTKESDVVRLANGKSCSSEIFDYINLAVIKAFPGSILQFRVVQRTLDRFEVETIVGSDRSGRGQELFGRLLREQLGDDIETTFSKVTEIKREPSGKLRYFLSEVN